MQHIGGLSGVDALCEFTSTYLFTFLWSIDQLLLYWFVATDADWLGWLFSGCRWQLEAWRNYKCLISRKTSSSFYRQRLVTTCCTGWSS